MITSITERPEKWSGQAQGACQGMALIYGFPQRMIKGLWQPGIRSRAWKIPLLEVLMASTGITEHKRSRMIPGSFLKGKPFLSPPFLLPLILPILPSFTGFVCPCLAQPSWSCSSAGFQARFSLLEVHTWLLLLVGSGAGGQGGVECWGQGRKRGKGLSPQLTFLWTHPWVL